AQITEQGGRALAWQADVANRFQCASLIEAARDAFGRVDILVHAASVQRSGPLDRLDEWDWRRVLDVNLTGAFFCTQLMGRVMAEEGGGVIVHIGATAGVGLTPPDGVSYTASKAGLIGLTRQSARELAPHGIRVNAVCPGNLLDSPLWVNSLYKQYAKKWGITEAEVRQRYIDQVPMKRGCTYDDVCNVVVFLASDQASYMTGQAINVTGGQEMR
ncbi:MAG: SDR family oxidoreductase, partial [Anaerolineae bacterium]|nr:SDR family oxidoreductase [Anaerolineae bacterium]